MEGGIELGQSGDARGVEYEHGMNHINSLQGVLQWFVLCNIASAGGSEINWIRRARDRPQPDRIPPHLHPTDSKMQVKYEKQAAEGETSK